MSIRFSSFFAFVSSLFLSFPALALTVGTDDRKVLPAEEIDPSTVAFVFGRKDVVTCTGTTIGLAHIITAAQCIFDYERGVLKSGITVIPGLHTYGDKRLTRRFHIKRAFVLRDFIEEVHFHGFSSYAASKDIAIVQVREFEGNTRFSELSPDMDVGDGTQINFEGQVFQVIGYAGGEGDIEGSQYYQPSLCQSLGKHNHLSAISHDCDTSVGSAGIGMVINKNTLVGIHTGGAAGGAVNSAALLTTDVLAEIKRIIRFEYDDLELFRLLGWSDPSYGRLRLRNSCRKDIQVALRYYDTDDQWVSDGYYTIDSGTEYHFPNKIKGDHLFYYAISTDGRYGWEGDHSFVVHGRTENAKRLDFPQYHSDHRLNISCD